MMKTLNETIEVAAYIANVAVSRSDEEAFYNKALFTAAGLFREAAAHADATPEIVALAVEAANVCAKAWGNPPTKVTAASIAFAAGIVRA